MDLYSDRASPYQLQLLQEHKDREARFKRAAIAAEFKRNEERRQRRPPVLVPRRLLVKKEQLAPPSLPPRPVYINNARLTIALVASRYGVDAVDLIGSRRIVRFVWPRQVAAYLLTVSSNRSLPQVGRIMGGRDHTTVIYGNKKVAARMRFDFRLFLEIDALRRQIVGEPPLAGLLPPPR